MANIRGRDQYQNNRPFIPEIALYVRLNILRAMQAFYSGNNSTANQCLMTAEMDIRKLQISDTDLVTLISMGYSLKYSRRALRFCGGNIQKSLDFLEKKRRERVQIKLDEEERLRKRQIARKYGQTKNGKFIDVDLLKKLRFMGVEIEIAVEALRQCNNHGENTLNCCLTNDTKLVLQQTLYKREMDEQSKYKIEQLLYVINFGLSMDTTMDDTSAINNNNNDDGIQYNFVAEEDGNNNESNAMEIEYKSEIVSNLINLLNDPSSTTDANSNNISVDSNTMVNDNQNTTAIEFDGNFEDIAVNDTTNIDIDEDMDEDMDDNYVENVTDMNVNGFEYDNNAYDNSVPVINTLPLEKSEPHLESRARAALLLSCNNVQNAIQLLIPMNGSVEDEQNIFDLERISITFQPYVLERRLREKKRQERLKIEEQQMTDAIAQSSAVISQSNGVNNNYEHMTFEEEDNNVDNNVDNIVDNIVDNEIDSENELEPNVNAFPNPSNMNYEEEENVEDVDIVADLDSVGYKTKTVDDYKIDEFVGGLAVEDDDSYLDLDLTLEKAALQNLKRLLNGEQISDVTNVSILTLSPNGNCNNGNGNDAGSNGSSK